MTIQIDDFCHSSNGDRGRLVRDTETGHRAVQHEPNLLRRAHYRDPCGGMAGAHWCQSGERGAAVATGKIGRYRAN
jgi:hypothetical protein